MQENTELLKKRFAQNELLLSAKQRQINTLLEITKAINQELNENSLFNFFSYVLQHQIKADKFAVFYRKTKWEKVSCINMDASKLSDIDFDTDFVLFKEAQKARKDKACFEEVDTIIPVFNNNNPIAYLLLGPLELYQIESFNEKIKFIETITSIVFNAAYNNFLLNKQLEQKVINKELEFAAKIQSMLIPEKLPNNEYIHASGLYLPHSDIGGDFYDMLELNDTEYAFCIADISGKGISAGLLMSNFQAHLRTLLNREYSLEQTLDHLNFRVNEITSGEKYITFFLGIYNLERRRLIYVNCGHHAPILINGDEVKTLDVGSTILGMLTPLPFINIGKEYLEPDSLLFMYTDGLTDLKDQNDEYMEFNDLQTYITENKDLNPEELNAKILNKIENERFNLSFFDDISMLSCRFK